MNGIITAPVNNPIIKTSPLFKTLSDLELNAVLAFLEPRNVKAGEIIFREGAPGEEMFILVSGLLSASVTQADGTQRAMFEIKSGDFFGEMSVIANESRSATFTAQEDSALLILSGIDFYRIIFEHPMIGIKILKAISSVHNIWLDQTSKYLNDLMRWGETARSRAVSDPLTGLYNRGFLDESANHRFQQGFVGARSVSLIMMDLDKIHEINESYGTKAGDTVFIAAAGVIRSSTRPGDICARLSGDEFSILLPDTKPEEAMNIAERIRGTMASLKIRIMKNPETMGYADIVVNTSLGIATAPVHADSWEKLCNAADTALLRSKELGRNRVEIIGR